MTEKLSKNPGQKNDRRTKIKVYSETSVTAGVESSIKKITAKLVGKLRERNIGQLITKKIETLPELPETHKEEITKKYLWLKRRGFPVPNTFRETNETNEFLISDLTENGKYILFDKHQPVNTEISNLTELHEQMRSMAIRAFNHGDGMVLGSDSYSLIYNPQTKTAKIILLDISRGTYRVGNYQARGRKHLIDENYVLRLVDHAISNYFS